MIIQKSKQSMDYNDQVTSNHVSFPDIESPDRLRMRRVIKNYSSMDEFVDKLDEMNK